MKDALLRLMTRPTFAGLTAPLLRDHATIFMLHRFRGSAREDEGSDPEELRQGLRFLRDSGYRFVSIVELLETMLAGKSVPRRAVAFSFDDGYAEQASVAAPLFAEFECPVTTFVTSGFLDGELWMWWDQIEWIFESTDARELELEHEGAPIAYVLSDPAERRRAQADFTARVKTVANEEKLAAIAKLASLARVDVPRSPPERYAPMTWSELRDAEELGMTFGPHTVTHPILSRTSAEQCRRELADSWSRLRDEARDPQPIFCYPNGQHGDFGVRETDLLAELGLVGAVTGIAGYASTDQLCASPEARFHVRRFAYPGDLDHVIQYVSGLERLKQILRREGAG